MKKVNLLVMLMAFAFGTIAQESNVPQKATLVQTADNMVIVPSITDQIASGTFIPSQDINKEVNPKQMGANKPVPGKGLPYGNDPLWEKQALVTKVKGKEPIFTFEAASSNTTPTDPTGAVGPNHYVNAWNSSFRIWDKEGNPLTAPAALGTILQGNMGDPIVFYDQFADRFVITEFYSNGFGMAVCQGPDPVNDGWYLYTFNLSSFPDYPKFSLWSDGYYITANKDSGSAGSSEVVFAVDRDKMLTGDPSAQMVGFPLTGITTSGFYSPLSFNANGNTPPPAGNSPIVYMQDDSWSGVSTDHLKIWSIDMDWATPGNSIISSPQIIDTEPFDGLFDGGSFSNLPQPSGQDIDALQATIMFMAQYRRFSGYNSAIFNFVVDLDGNDDYAGIRWYELRQDNDGDPWEIYQEGTYSQPDGHSAFSGNMCMDGSGNIALAYSVVSSTQYVSLRYTGRNAGDPLGTMTFEEETIADGTQSNPSFRYGDYSQMTIDPVDDATFWSIGEYFTGGSRKNHVGVFQLAAPVLTAGFFGEPTTVCSGQSVTFTDASLAEPTSWDWSFPGGTPDSYSGQTPPAIIYGNAGVFDVSLTVGNGSETDTEEKTSYITVKDIFAEFSGTPTTVVAGNTVTFADESGCAPTSWDWSFPGGSPNSFTGQNPPSIQYDNVGLFDVTLTVVNALGTDTKTYEDYINVFNCSYCVTSYSNQADDWISNVTFNDIDNSTAAEPGGYGDYTNESTPVGLNSIYDLSVEVTVNGAWTQNVWAWIDWDQNCILDDAGEAYDLGETPGTGGTHTLTTSISVPADALLGAARMRVVELYSTDPEPCDESTYGEAEDYTVNVILSTGIDQNIESNEMIISHTGNNSYLVSYSATKAKGPLTISVYDLMGRTLIQNRVEGINGKYQYDFDMSYAMPGVYLVRLGNNSFVKSKRIVVK